jgi:hypothetical protein
VTLTNNRQVISSERAPHKVNNSYFLTQNSVESYTHTLDNMTTNIFTHFVCRNLCVELYKYGNMQILGVICDNIYIARFDGLKFVLKIYS